MANQPVDSSLKHFSPFSSSLNESGFLPHHPMSSAIASITHGFRFAAPVKQHLVTGKGGVGPGGGVQKVNDIFNRERTDAEMNGTEAEGSTPDPNCCFSDDELIPIEIRRCSTQSICSNISPCFSPPHSSITTIITSYYRLHFYHIRGANDASTISISASN